MIILAASIILSLNSSGIIGKANKAKGESNAANMKEAAAIAYSEYQLNKNLNNSISQTAEEYVKEKLKTQGFVDNELQNLIVSESEGIIVMGFEKYTYTDNNGVSVIIPTGFVASNVTTEDDIAEGLVIYEGTELVTSTNVVEAQKTRNQYVWVPVEGTPTRKYFDYNMSGYPSSKMTSYASNRPLEKEEYDLLMASIEKNGGFYIARYEAGLPSGKTIESVAIDGTDKPLSIKGATVWNNIAWDATWGELSSSKKKNNFGSFENPGAAKVARATLNTNEVASHLIYSEEWDAALDFIAKTNPTYIELANSDTTLGMYGSNKKPAGYYAANNIYDLGGNYSEWTMETYASSTGYGNRTTRGSKFGSCSTSCTYYRSPANRSGNEPDRTASFRVALYLK